MLESTVESSSKLAVGLTEKKPIRILHVDDEAGFLKGAKQILEMQGPFQVDTASSVEEALEKMKKKPYDAVVSDYVMPEKSGLEFLKELRQKGNTVPFIIFTGKGRGEVVVEALNLGADSYINKIGGSETVYGELAHGICQAVERKRVYVEVWRREERLKAVLASSPDIISVSDLQGKIVDCNEAAWKLSGFSSKEELLGKSSFEFIAEKDRERAMENLKKTLEKGSVSNIEYTLLKKGGEEYVGELSASILKDSSGNPAGFVSVVRNITERKKAEDKISQQNEFLTNVLESLTHPFLVIDANDYTVKMANSTFGFGTSSEKSTCYEVTHKRKKPCSAEHPCPLEIVKKTKKSAVVEHIHYDEEENPRIVEVHGYPILDNDGIVVQMIEYYLDITEQRKAEQELWDAREKWVSLTENTDDVIMILDCKGIIQYLNPAPLVANPREAIGKSALEYVPREQHDIMREALRRVFKTGKPDSYEVSPSIQGIGNIWFNTKVVPIKHDKKTVSAILISTNITERKKVEKELRMKKATISASQNSIGITDLEGNLIYVNDSFLRLYEYDDKSEVLGKPGASFWTPVEEAKKAIMELRKSGKWRGELLARKKDGSVANVLLSASVVADETGKPSCLMASGIDITKQKKAEETMRESEEKYRGIVELAPDGIATMNMKGVVTSVNSAFLRLTGFSKDEIVGKYFTKIGTLRARDLPRYIKLFGSIVRGKIPPPMEFAYLRKDGTQCWGEAHSSLLKEGGKTVGFQAILRDTTERKKTLEKLETLYEKLHVVGELTRHDIRNKLQAVISNAYLSKQMLTDDHETMKYLGDIESACEQVERILDFARTYEKLGIEELAYMDVEKILKEAVALFSDLHGIKVANECRGLTVLADSLLRQILYNLIHNSLTHGETVTRIRVYHEEIGRNRLRLVYEDDGVGIPRAEKEKIFGEGYGKGTGYGLYLIRKICEVYGWAIQETGKQGRGAQFTITIPKMNESRKISYRLH